MRSCSLTNLLGPLHIMNSCPIALLSENRIAYLHITTHFCFIPSAFWSILSPWTILFLQTIIIKYSSLIIKDHFLILDDSLLETSHTISEEGKQSQSPFTLWFRVNLNFHLWPSHIRITLLQHFMPFSPISIFQKAILSLFHNNPDSWINYWRAKWSFNRWHSLFWISLNIVLLPHSWASCSLKILPSKHTTL